MSWPIPVFTQIEYPKPISMRSWLPTLAAIAACAVAAVLLLWPQGKPTNTFQFWSALIGAPLGACALVFGIRLNDWEDEQTDAEEAEGEQDRLRGLWREWSRRNLRVVDAVAFTPATDKIATFAEAKVDLPTNWDRAVGFGLAKNRSIVFRRKRLLHVVARRFAGDLQSRPEVVITLMLDDTSPEQINTWTPLVERFFGRVTPGLTIRVEAELVTSGVQWITQLVDTVDRSTRLVIAAQFWADNEKEHKFSEGAAAFLIDPGATSTGSIFRPMTGVRDTLDAALSQIQEIQTSPDWLTDVWSAGCELEDSSVLRSVLKAKPKQPMTEHLLDGFLGNPGPASGWIALAIAMEAMRGAGPQLVAWREPKSEYLSLCTISPVPQKETTG